MSDTLSTTPKGLDADVIVIGGGNAGFSAAHAAAERGRKVILLERGEGDRAGGNSYFTAGATRIAHDGLEDLKDFVEFDERHENTVVPPYSPDEYRSDLERVTEGRTDPRMADILVNEAADALRWLKSLGLKYRLMYERQAYKRPDGSYLFWGGLHVGNVDGGVGLIADHTRVAERNGVDIRYGVRALDLIFEDGKVIGVIAEKDGQQFSLRAESTVIASGGFEASPEMRAEHLGERWANARVRGTLYNVGDMLKAALKIGAAKGGDWETCHSVQWDANPEINESNIELTNRLTRQSYFLGLLVNNEGKRFLDEGADFRNYTYAKYGKVILEQPNSVAYQIFDADLRPTLRTEEYDMPGISEVKADSLEQLAQQIGIDSDTFVKTVNDFNENVNDAKFDPTIKDGKASSVAPPKSNWATPIDKAPFYAYPVTCGITFTFGGLKGDDNGRVLNESGEVIPGLLACGEALGGLFSTNYPGGSGVARKSWTRSGAT